MKLIKENIMNRLLFATIIGLTLFLLSCEEKIPKGCCYWNTLSSGQWSCGDDTFQNICEDQIGEGSTPSYFLEDTDCITVQYCKESSCEAMGCDWDDESYSDLCICQ